MVFFICNGCGSSLKKNNVEKHQYQCRKSGHFSCMDCSKDFYGEEYKTHVKCISEEEKYSAKGWVPKQNQNKNERKQTEWVSMVQELVNSVKLSDPALSRVLQTISQHENIPRKKPKFMNFLKNIFGNRSNPKVAEQAWDLISKALDEQKAKIAMEEQKAKVAIEEQKAKVVMEEQKAKSSNGSGNGEVNPNNKENASNGKRKKGNEDEPHQKKKRKIDAQDEVNAEIESNDNKEIPVQANTPNVKVKWSTIGKIILRSREDKELSLKKFQKKIIPEYLNRVGNSGQEFPVEVLWSKCLKKLSKNPKFKVHKEHIKLVS